MDLLKNLFKTVPKSAVPAGLALGAFLGCGRDFSTPWLPTGPAADSTVAVDVNPGTTGPDTLPSGGTDPIVIDAGPVVDSGSVVIDPGPVVVDSGPVVVDPGPIVIDSEPGGTDPGPVVVDSGSVGIDPGPILIDSLEVSDLLLVVGELLPAPVAVLPADATSPGYGMSSSDPRIADVTAQGIVGIGAGAVSITVRALDGSGATAVFKVSVRPADAGAIDTAGGPPQDSHCKESSRPCHGKTKRKGKHGG